MKAMVEESLMQLGNVQLGVKLADVSHETKTLLRYMLMSIFGESIYLGKWWYLIEKSNWTKVYNYMR